MLNRANRADPAKFVRKWTFQICRCIAITVCSNAQIAIISYSRRSSIIAWLVLVIFVEITLLREELYSIWWDSHIKSSKFLLGRSKSHWVRQKTYRTYLPHTHCYYYYRYSSLIITTSLSFQARYRFF